MKKFILLVAAVMLTTSTACTKKVSSRDRQATVSESTTAAAQQASAVPSVVKSLPTNLTGKEILPALAKNYPGSLWRLTLTAAPGSELDRQFIITRG